MSLSPTYIASCYIVISVEKHLRSYLYEFCKSLYRLAVDSSGAPNFIPSSPFVSLSSSDQLNTFPANNFFICPNCGLDFGSGFLSKKLQTICTHVHLRIHSHTVGLLINQLHTSTLSSFYRWSLSSQEEEGAYNHCQLFPMPLN